MLFLKYPSHIRYLLPMVILVIGLITFGTGTDTDSERLVAELENPDISARSQQIVPIEGNGELTNFNTASIGLDTVIIRDAPGTIIEGELFVGRNLTLINSPNSIIRNNTFQDIASVTSTFAIRLQNSSNSIIEGNDIRTISSTADTSPAVVGIEISQSNDIIVIDNRIQDLNAENPDQGITGIFLTEVNRIEIIGNRIGKLSSGGDTYGIYARGSSEVVVINNEFLSLSAINNARAFSIGIFDSGTSHIIVQGNIMDDLWSQSSDHALSSGVIFYQSTEVIFEDNEMTQLRPNGGGRMEAYPILLVDSISDFTFEFGKTVDVYFTSEDPNYDSYRLYLDGTEIDVGTWQSTSWFDSQRINLRVDT
ncbi:MAG: hypothetical protein ACW99Q_12775, partial [Candidatus Kariarchaeaceae archaeon]